MKRLIFLAVLAFMACKSDETAHAPAAVELTEEAAGHYCQMVILEHQGPKAQVHLAGMAAPLWFSQVRDGLAYLKSEEQDGDITVLYVNDMGAAISWLEPGPENWIDATDAFYVIDSDAIGGMGAPEIAPFGTRADAEAFVVDHGGQIRRLDEISAEYVLAPIDHAAVGAIN